MSPGSSDGGAQESEAIFGDACSQDSGIVEQEYDRFAEEGAYDETFERWGYVAPLTAAAIMRNFEPASARILDAACGSGLSGTALHAAGYRHIDGIDISRRLLALARETGAYEQLRRVDMQQLPLPVEDDYYDAVTCIGALTYFEGTDILEDLCRIVKPGGHVLFTLRDDIMGDRDYAARLADIEERGIWSRAFGTEPLPYLPGNPRYGDRIRIRYLVYRVREQ